MRYSVTATSSPSEQRAVVFQLDPIKSLQNLQLTARIEALTDQAERPPLDDQPLF